MLRLLASGNMVADAETFGMNQAQIEKVANMLGGEIAVVCRTGHKRIAAIIAIDVEEHPHQLNVYFTIDIDLYGKCII